MTQLLYYEDSYCFTATAKATVVSTWEDGRPALALDQTIFYPQGGGQPYDTGLIESSTTRFRVEEVRYQNDEVWHIGQFEEGEMGVGDEVTLHIDEAKRRLHARLHSAAHVLDAILFQKYPHLKPLRGYHFPDSPFVEYEGGVDTTESFRSELEAALNARLQAGGPVEKQLETGAHATGKPLRTVSMAGHSCPCGGTHVEDIREVGHITLPKISSKKGLTRIRYDLT